MKYINPIIESFYHQNNLGETFYNLVLDIKPKIIIEFGTLYGYSAICMAMALDELKEGKIICYDLWDKYKYKHSTKDQTLKNIQFYNVEKYIELKDGDFYSINFDEIEYNLLHLDISNDGNVIKDLYNKTKNKNGEVIFEGGNQERDNVEWMIKYNKKLINNCGVKYKVLNNDFPSLSMIEK